MSDIVIVNGEAISSDMFEAFFKRVLYELQEDEDFEVTKENTKFIKAEALNNLIERTIVLQEAKKENISISDENVISKLNEIKSSANSEEELKEILGKLGLNETSLFEKIKKEEIINKYFLNHGLKEIRFSEDELKNFYENNKNFIKEPDILTVYELYVENEDKAIDISNDLKNLNMKEIDEKLNNDNIDYFLHKEIPDYKLPPEFIEALAENLITDNIFLLKSEVGYFIYKIIDRKIGKKPAFDEIKKEIAEYLIKETQKEIREKIIERLFEKADIKYIDVSLLEE